MKSALRLVLVLLSSALGAPALAAEATGEFWEMTTKMEMPGMPAEMAGVMGGAPQKVCRLKGQEGQPVSGRGREDCTMSNVRRSGNNTITFDMTCTGKDAMTGSGEITSTPNSFSQRVKMKMDGQDMTIVSTGKRVGGACKGDEQINEVFAGAGAAQTKSCQAALDENRYEQFLRVDEKYTRDSKAQCAAMPTAESRRNCEAATDAGCTRLRPQMCARLGTDLKSYDKFNSFAKKGLALADECGLGPDKIVQQHCTTGLDRKDWRFVAEYCKTDGRLADLRKQHCIGRDYTTVDANQRDMCVAIGGLSAGTVGGAASAPARPVAQKEPPKASALEEVKKEGVKALKDMFKF